jgi:hypothetical protein
MLDIIQSLWVGDKLSPMEQICIKSYLRMGHPFHLYTYGPVKGVPVGAVVKDANQIVPKWKIETFQNLANFSDYFRYLMLWKNGNWWSDLDSFCLRPFNFTDPYVFATQLSSNPGHPQDLCGGVMKVPSNSEIMRYCMERVAETDVKANDWADIGPALIMESVPRFDLVRYAKSKWFFCPLDHFDAPANIFGPESGKQCVGDAHAIHLWNEEARRGGIDKFGSYPGSLFEWLKRSVE